MNWIATAEECRELDRQAEARGVQVEELMHEAGRAVAACVLQHFPDAKRVTVVCGKGNNGGDGLVTARLLAERQKKVAVLVAARRDELNANAIREIARLLEPGLIPVFCSDRSWPEELAGLRHVDVIVDALLGTGARGAPEGPVAEAILEITSCGRPVVAVDIPSGVDCDTGQLPGAAVYAARTVTFGLPKPFLFQGEAVERVGEWEVAPIGFPEALLGQPRSARLIDAAEVRALLPGRKKEAHKGSEGHVLVVAGSDRMPGAAVLSAYAALRAGAGLVTVASTPHACQLVATHIPEAILLPLPDAGGELALRGAQRVEQAFKNCSAVVFGPGLGTSSETAELLRAIWPKLERPAVIDADALNLAAGGVPLPPGETILTPHPGEAGRLLSIEARQVQATRFLSARNLAKTFGKVALLKGAATLIAGGDAPLSVNPTGNSGMAAPGMGDVLSGILGALLAKGLRPSDAAIVGAYWHGLAGDLCAAEIGPAGFLASEVADMLPRARATIASSCEVA